MKTYAPSSLTTLLLMWMISSCLGTVAWWYCILDDINEWKGQPANWENTRWAGVTEKRDGNWVIVQQHFSFARQ